MSQWVDIIEVHLLDEKEKFKTFNNTIHSLSGMVYLLMRFTVPCDRCGSWKNLQVTKLQPVGRSDLGCFKFKMFIIHTINVWYIYLHFGWSVIINVGKYTIHGWYGSWFIKKINRCQAVNLSVPSRPWPRRWGWAPHQQVPMKTEVANQLRSGVQYGLISVHPMVTPWYPCLSCFILTFKGHSGTISYNL